MVRSIIGKGLFFRIAPAGRTALVRALYADHMIYVYKVAGFASVQAYGDVGFIATVVEVFVVIVVSRSYTRRKNYQ